MKKLLILTTLLVMGFIVTACNEPEPEPDPVADAQALLDAIDLEDGTLEESITLPTVAGDYTITWVSTNPDLLNETGEVTRPESGGGTVILKASITIEGVSYHREFYMTIPSLSAEELAYLTLNQALDSLNIPEEVESNLSMPSRIDEITLTWSSSDEHLITPTGAVNKPLNNSGSQPVDLTVVLNYQDYEIEETFNVILMPQNAPVITNTRILDFTSHATEYLVADGTIETYYMNNREIPYVSVLDFLALIDGAIIYNDIEYLIDDGVLTIFYEVEYDDEVYDDDYFEFVINFNDNIAAVNRFGFFSSLAEATQTDFGAGLETVDYVYNAADPVELDLAFYRIEIAYFETEDVYLMPLHLANLFFTGSMYDVYYNGDEVHGVDTYQVLDDPEIIAMLNNSSYNDKSLPSHVKQFTYNTLAFTFDHFYGLRDVQGVDTYYDVFDWYRYELMGTDTFHYQALNDLVNGLDDLHSWHTINGFYEENMRIPRRLEDLGPNSQLFYNFRGTHGSYCGTMPPVRYLDDEKIAVIFIERFNEQTPLDFADHIVAIEAKGTVEKIVVDLSCNGGGIIGTMLQILGYMTDDPIELHGRNVGDTSTYTSYISSEIEALDYNWYILTSRATFSAANLMASIAKDMGIATLVGARSQGGACSITTNILPSGTILFMSSPSMLTNVNYESIETGISVDIALLPSLFDDDDALKAALD